MGSDPQLSHRAVAALRRPDGPVFLSAASVFEIGIKHRLGKLYLADPYVHDLERAAARAGFVQLPISWAHAARTRTLETEHKDPFDRLLFAQALCEDLTFVSNEKVADEAGVRRLW